MNSFSIFYLLPLFCVSFAPAQANREKVCKLASASVVKAVTQKNLKTFDGSNIQLYKSYDSSLGKTFFQIKQSWLSKSDDFAINLHSSVLVEKEITARYDSEIYRLTLDGDTSTFYRNVVSLDEFTENFKVNKFTLEGKTLDITAIKVKTDRYVWIFMAVSGDTPRLVFPSNKVKSMSHTTVREEMNFNVEGDKNYPVFVEFDCLDNANKFHEYVDRT